MVLATLYRKTKFTLANCGFALCERNKCLESVKLVLYRPELVCLLIALKMSWLLMDLRGLITDGTMKL